MHAMTTLTDPYNRLDFVAGTVSHYVSFAFATVDGAIVLHAVRETPQDGPQVFFGPEAFSPHAAPARAADLVAEGLRWLHRLGIEHDEIGWGRIERFEQAVRAAALVVTAERREVYGVGWAA
jgi:hypothetical protein